MGTEQHLHVVKFGHLFMVDGDEPKLLQAFTFHSVVNDVTQTIQGGTLGQFLFCLTDGSRHTEAKPLPLSISICITSSFA